MKPVYFTHCCSRFSVISIKSETQWGFKYTDLISTSPIKNTYFPPVLHPSAAAPAEHRRAPPSVTFKNSASLPLLSSSDLYVTLLRWHACITWPRAATMFHAAANECNEGHSQHMCPLSVWLRVYCMFELQIKLASLKYTGHFAKDVIE